MGDLKNDGTIDFLITSGWSGVYGFHSGRAFIVSSGFKPTDCFRPNKFMCCINGTFQP